MTDVGTKYPITPNRKSPKRNCMIPERKTAKKKTSKFPLKVEIPATTMVIKPAAGPLTPNFEPLNMVTIIPPIIPAIKPENAFTSDPLAIPIHKGSATNQTTNEAGKSFLKCFKLKLLFFVFDMLIN